MNNQEILDKMQEMFSATVPEEMKKQMEAFLPKVDVSKNGYEIRLKVLELANNTLWQDYYAKLGQLETSVRKEHDEIVIKTDGIPTVPSIPQVEDIIKAATSMYQFVNNK